MTASSCSIVARICSRTAAVGAVGLAQAGVWRSLAKGLGEDGGHRQRSADVPVGHSLWSEAPTFVHQDNRVATIAHIVLAWTQAAPTTAEKVASGWRHAAVEGIPY